VRWQVVDVPPIAPLVTEYQLAARQCGGCGQVTRAALPAAAGPLGFGPRLLAVVALLSGRYRLSKREAAQCVADLFGVDLAVGTVAAIEQVVSTAREPVVVEVQAAVQRAAVANLDETGWRERRKRVWLWTVVTATLTVFHINASRGGKVAQALLGQGWHGILGSDRGPMYSWYDRQRRQVCWAHLKRDFQKLVVWGAGARPTGKRLLAIEAEVFARWHRYRDGTITRAALVRELAPHQTAMRQVREAAVAGTDAKAAGVCHELLNLWPALWTFVSVDGVEPTNNAAEQALRPAVLWRKGSFGTHSVAGSRFVERMLTVTITCRQQQRPLFAFLVAAVEAACHGTPAPSLLTPSCPAQAA
jgi:transposase